MYFLFLKYLSFAHTSAPFLTLSFHDRLEEFFLHVDILIRSIKSINCSFEHGPIYPDNGMETLSLQARGWETKRSPNPMPLLTLSAAQLL